MTQKLEIFRCNICKNIVEVILEGEGTLVCCGEEMELLKPGTTDGTQEKHVPVIDYDCDEGGVKIRVGELPHPMESEHYIQFVEAIGNEGKTIHREYLHPGEKPEICVNCRSDLAKRRGLKAREYCNIHGLYKSADEN